VSGVTLRPAHERDVERAGDVSFAAFYHVAVAHGLAPAVTLPEESRRYLRHLLQLDPLGGVIAEDDAEVVGVAWTHRRGPVATIGPLAVVPHAQGRGIGRRLLERAIEVAGPGQIRLVQESYNDVSLGLYLRTGFRVLAPLIDLRLPAGGPVGTHEAGAGIIVRPAGSDDRVRLVARDARAFGAERPQSVDLYLRHGRALVAERSGGLAGYAFAIGSRGTAYLGSASADDAGVVLQLLTTLAGEFAGSGHTVRVTVPGTDRPLVEGLVRAGFRVFRACQYMVRGGGTAPPPNYVLMNGDLL
jgi:GNAT superfamily N-acetyltransferase